MQISPWQGRTGTAQWPAARAPAEVARFCCVCGARLRMHCPPRRRRARAPRQRSGSCALRQHRVVACKTRVRIARSQLTSVGRPLIAFPRAPPRARARSLLPAAAARWRRRCPCPSTRCPPCTSGTSLLTTSTSAIPSRAARCICRSREAWPAAPRRARWSSGRVMPSFAPRAAWVRRTTCSSFLRATRRRRRRRPRTSCRRPSWRPGRTRGSSRCT